VSNCSEHRTAYYYSGAGVPSDHSTTQTMKIVAPSSGSLAAITGEPGNSRPSFSSHRPEQKTLDVDGADIVMESISRFDQGG